MEKIRHNNRRGIGSVQFMMMNLPAIGGWDRLNKEVPTFWEISRFWWKFGLCARGDTLRETHTQFYFAVS